MKVVGYSILSDYSAIYLKLHSFGLSWSFYYWCCLILEIIVKLCNIWTFSISIIFCKCSVLCAPRHISRYIYQLPPIICTRQLYPSMSKIDMKKSTSVFICGCLLYTSINFTCYLSPPTDNMYQVTLSSKAVTYEEKALFFLIYVCIWTWDLLVFNPLQWPLGRTLGCCVMDFIWVII